MPLIILIKGFLLVSHCPGAVPQGDRVGYRVGCHPESRPEFISGSFQDLGRWIIFLETLMHSSGASRIDPVYNYDIKLLVIERQTVKFRILLFRRTQIAVEPVQGFLYESVPRYKMVGVVQDKSFVFFRSTEKIIHGLDGCFIRAHHVILTIEHESWDINP
jgi:hypothetical protein